VLEPAGGQVLCHTFARGRSWPEFVYAADRAGQEKVINWLRTWAKGNGWNIEE
jgi:hypothetical protein